MAISPRLLFLSFLGLGLVTGLFLGSLGQAMAAPIHNDGQYNVLFILVDDLSAKNPTLEGIWLAANTAGSDQWNWMPIYPAPLDDTDNAYAQPHSAFYLPDADFQDVNSLPPVRANGVFWDQVFWLDKAALAALQTAIGHSPVELTDAWMEPQRALYEQVQVLNNLCQADPASTSANPGLLDQMLGLMPDHLRFSLNQFDLITRWDDWADHGFALSCSHPWAD